ncbi:MAG: hypothetical protein ABI534_10800 [Chloroflexota bacterium]
MKLHRFDAVSFVFGAIFVALGLLVTLGESSSLLSAWLVPAVVIGLGLLLLLAAWQGSRPSAEPAQPSPATQD